MRFTPKFRWLPTPYRSVLLFVVWLLLNQSVEAVHLFFGALLAMILFELSKRGFAVYVTHFPAYDTLYGALALVPIVFVWVYLCWLVVLLGAEMTALLQQIAADTEKADADDPDQIDPSEDETGVKL